MKWGEWKEEDEKKMWKKLFPSYTNFIPVSSCAELSRDNNAVFLFLNCFVIRF